MTQRIALVTGGSRGLGKNAALKLAAKGTDILLTYHSNRQAALDVVAEIEKRGQSGSISAERRRFHNIRRIRQRGGAGAGAEVGTHYL